MSLPNLSDIKKHEYYEVYVYNTKDRLLSAKVISGSATLSVEEVDPSTYGGRYALKITVPAGQEAIVVFRPVPVKPGAKYLVIFYGKMPSSTVKYKQGIYLHGDDTFTATPLALAFVQTEWAGRGLGEMMVQLAYPVSEIHPYAAPALYIRNDDTVDRTTEITFAALKLLDGAPFTPYTITPALEVTNTTEATLISEKIYVSGLIKKKFYRVVVGIYALSDGVNTLTLKAKINGKDIGSVSITSATRQWYTIGAWIKRSVGGDLDFELTGYTTGGTPRIDRIYVRIDDEADELREQQNYVEKSLTVPAGSSASDYILWGGVVHYYVDELEIVTPTNTSAELTEAVTGQTIDKIAANTTKTVSYKAALRGLKITGTNSGTSDETITIKCKYRKIDALLE